MAELFSVQDDITREIVGSLQVELTEGEQARVVYSSTRNLDAWAGVIQATGLIARFTKADNAKARELAESAVALDPEYASGWTTLAWTHWIDMRFGFSASREESFDRAVELATKAAILDPELSSAQSLLGSIHLARREYDEAMSKGRRAIDLSPNNADDHALLALTVYYVGNWGDAIELLQRAMRLSPHYPSWYLLYQGRAQTFKGDHEDAIATHEMGLTRAESSDMRAGFHSALAFAHIAAGHEQLAREHMAKRLKLTRNFSVRQARKSAFFKNSHDLDRYLDALRKTGLPETPPPISP
jgi:adenylate cyclase